MPNTIFLGKEVIVLPSCHSTNDYAQELLRFTEVREGTVVIAHEQLSGRGQMGNGWEAESGKNLTFSVILKPVWLASNQQFLLSMTVALAIRYALQLYTDEIVSVKWPNDIYVSDYKIGGVLIENVLNSKFIKSAVIGIGINVNQIQFINKRATSLAKINQKEFQLDEVFCVVVKHLEEKYLSLQRLDFINIKTDYHRHLYGLNINRQFIINNDVTNGKIKGIEDSGRLVVEIASEMYSFDLKQISYAFD